MSVLFPKVNKAPEWHWRPIYYDPKKDEMEQKLRKLQNERAHEEGDSREAGDKTPEGYTPTLHRGSFRQAHEENASMNQKARHQSRLAFWIALLGMLLLMFWLLS